MDRRLLKRALRAPKMWFPLAKYGAAKVAGLSSVVLPSDGIRLEVGTGRGRGAWAAISGEAYEPELVPWLERIKPGNVVLDIGANIGTYTLRAACKVGPSGRVVSFEPMPETFARLQRNVRLNRMGHVSLIPKAAGAAEAVARFATTGHYSSASLCQGSGAEVFTVPVTTVDAVVRELGLARMDVVKMDIEGAEPEALQGMKQSIATFQPVILFENGAAGGATRTLLESWGYEVGMWDRRGFWTPEALSGNLFARPVRP